MEFKKPVRHKSRSESVTPVHDKTPQDATSAQTDADSGQARQLTYVVRTLVTVGVVVVVVIGYLAIVLMSHKPGETSGVNRTLSGPEYQTVVPAGKSVEDLGGWKRVSPPENDPVYAYEDTIDGVGISVSQQPLPETFTGKIDHQVAELAKKFNATDKLDADGTTVYVGTSAKGPQSVILTKNRLLILIKSQKKISDASWVSYIKSLNILDADQLPKY